MRGLDLENFQLSLDLVTIEDWTLKILVEVELWKILFKLNLDIFQIRT